VEGDRTNWFSAAFIVASRETAGATLGMTPTVAQNPDNINDYLNDVLASIAAVLLRAAYYLASSESQFSITRVFFAQ
jgi:hypothetical protein